MLFLGSDILRTLFRERTGDLVNSEIDTIAYPELGKKPLDGDVAGLPYVKAHLAAPCFFLWRFLCLLLILGIGRRKPQKKSEDAEDENFAQRSTHNPLRLGDEHNTRPPDANGEDDGGLPSSKMQVFPLIRNIRSSIVKDRAPTRAL